MNELCIVSYIRKANTSASVLVETVLLSSTMLGETTKRNLNLSNLTRIRKYILDLIGVSDSVNEENDWVTVSTRLSRTDELSRY